MYHVQQSNLDRINYLFRQESPHIYILYKLTYVKAVIESFPSLGGVSPVTTRSTGTKIPQLHFKV